MHPFQLELQTARDIALDAAQLVRTFKGTSIQIDLKPGDEPVTEADRNANALIVERLRRAFPADVILSEELPDDGARLGQTRVWMVDPIDGTRDFIQGEPGYAVMIGLCVDGRPRVGVVCQPVTGITYLGVPGVGAWKEVAGGPRVSMRTSGLAAPPGIRLVASKSHRTPNVDAFKQALAITDELNIGSVGLKMSLVAEGARDLYVYPNDRTKLWDSCGPEAILTAAGGTVTDLDGQPLAYGERELHNLRGIVASNGPLHCRVIDAIRGLNLLMPRAG